MPSSTALSGRWAVVRSLERSGTGVSERRIAAGLSAWLVVAASSPAQAFTQTTSATEIDSFVAAAGPFIAQFALGGILGFCAGFAIKKVGKVVAIVVGLVFVLLQVMAYYKVIEIDWAPIAGWWDVVRSTETIETVGTTVGTILFANVPALIGAVPGFVLGLKRG